jgi:ribosomal protein S27AE
MTQPRKSRPSEEKRLQRSNDWADRPHNDSTLRNRAVAIGDEVVDELIPSPTRRPGHGGTAVVSEADFCPECGGGIVQRHDGKPGRRCGMCGLEEEPGVKVEINLGGNWQKALIRRGWSS